MSRRTFKVIFNNGRVGRRRDVAPVMVEMDTITEPGWPLTDVLLRRLEGEVFRAVRPMLASSDVEVWVEDGRGGVEVGGFRTVASFTVEELVEVVS